MKKKTLMVGMILGILVLSSTFVFATEVYPNFCPDFRPGNCASGMCGWFKDGETIWERTKCIGDSPYDYACNYLGAGCCYADHLATPGWYVHHYATREVDGVSEICCYEEWVEGETEIDCGPGPIYCDSRVYCEYDHNADGTMNELDISLFMENFGRHKNYNPCFVEGMSGEGCYGDYDHDGDVDGLDYITFQYVLERRWWFDCSLSKAAYSYESTDCGFTIRQNLYQPESLFCGTPEVLYSDVVEECFQYP